MKLFFQDTLWKDTKSSHKLMLIIVLALGVSNFFWGELVPAGGGFGWDGVFYAEMVRHLDLMIDGGQLSSYYAQRILPSSIVRGMLVLSNTAITDSNIIRGFELYNLTLMLGAVVIWKRLSEYFSLSIAGRWIGFSGIFINFQSSKQAFFYPVLTDVTALFVGMLLLLFYVEKKPIALFITTLIGAFCWPVVSLCGALLILFMRTKLGSGNTASFPTFSKPSNLPRHILISAIVVIALSIIGYIYLWQNGPLPELACKMPRLVASEMSLSSFPCTFERIRIGLERFLTALPSLVGLAIALIMLVGTRAYFQRAFKNLRNTPIAIFMLAFGAFFIPMGIVKLIANPDVANPSSLKLIIEYSLLPPQQEGKFLLPIVSLAVFWGPVVLLLLLHWKAYCVEARKLGLGVVAVIGVSLPFGLVGEPRFLTIAWPFLVLGIVLALENKSTKPSFKYVFALLTVLYAQFWIKLTITPWPEPDYAGLQDFPKQLYFMHYGLWMSWLSYVAQSIALILSIVWLHKTFVKSNT